MFTGIIEDQGMIASLEKENSNVQIGVRSAFTSELKIDQSVCHNGVCLT
ncbi:MAG: riboflavin synthase, partial [Bacteroidia bacterium]|nr:riboflavin synthase [Bacteroidia bacterium]